MSSFDKEMHDYASMMHRPGAAASRLPATPPAQGSPAGAGAGRHEETPYSLIL
jgi:hypothetical protein